MPAPAHGSAAAVTTALDALTADLTPEIAASIATAAIRLALAAYAFIEARAGRHPGAEALLTLAEALAPARMAA